MFGHSIVNSFSSVMNENGFLQHVQSLTHYCARSGLMNSLIDHIWTNFERNFSVQTHPKVSDHLPISVEFPLKCEGALVVNEFRNFSCENVKKFNRVKPLLLREYVVDMNSTADLEFDRFYEELKRTLDTFFPLCRKQSSLKKLRMPWITSEIIPLINKKHNLFRMLKSREVSYQYFKAYSNLLAIVIKVNKRNYFSNKFKVNEKDGKKMWNTINRLFGRKKKETVCELKLDDGTTITNSLEINKHFNKFFVEKPKKIHSDIERSLHDYTDLVPINNKSFFLSPATASEVSNTIRKLKTRVVELNFRSGS